MSWSSHPRYTSIYLLVAYDIMQLSVGNISKALLSYCFFFVSIYAPKEILSWKEEIILAHHASLMTAHAKWSKQSAQTVEKNVRYRSSQQKVDQSTVRNAFQNTGRHGTGSKYCLNLTVQTHHFSNICTYMLRFMQICIITLSSCIQSVNPAVCLYFGVFVCVLQEKPC